MPDQTAPPTQSGPLTFLFTDIEGHSALWEAAPDAMAAALREHDQLIHDVVGDWAGRVVKMAGDGAMVVFDDASAAVDAAVQLQRELAERSWLEIGALRVRMGLHTGAAESRDDDFFGPEVIRAARLCDAGHGGQIIASGSVAQLTGSEGWIELGNHRLRGLDDPVALFQVVAPGLQTEFPTVRTLDARPNTLARFRTDFVGREKEIRDLGRLLERNPLVTLTGVGGSGKTRLAVELAHARVGDYADGVFFADLAPLTDDSRLWETMATALELPYGGSGPGMVDTARAGVLRHVRRREALIIVDNCEHLLDAASDLVDELLDAGEQLTIVATSREGLSVEGERIVQVASLPIDTDAVALLRDRAAASGADEISDEVAGRICSQLDGIPLAIELAAARCGQLGAAAVVDLLADRFRLLTGSKRRVPRQRTLEATLDWSYDLLSTDEQELLRRLSVFDGSFSLDAAKAVAQAEVDLLGSLVDKSLVQNTDSGRFRLLETVRAYGEQQLLAVGDPDEERRALADWVCAELESFEFDNVEDSLVDLQRFVDQEIDQIHGALGWAAARDDWTTVVRIAAPTALSAMGDLDPRLAPLRHQLRHALEAGVSGELRHRCLAAFVIVGGGMEGDPRLSLYEEAAEMARDRSDVWTVLALVSVANMVNTVGLVSADESELRRADEMVARAAVVAADLGAAWQATPEAFRGYVALNEMRWDDARRHAEKSLALAAEGGMNRVPGWYVSLAAVSAHSCGKPYTNEQLDSLVARLGPTSSLYYSLPLFLAAVAAPPADGSRPTMNLDARVYETPVEVAITEMLVCVATIAQRCGDARTASKLLAAARSRDAPFSTQIGVALYRTLIPKLRAELSEEERRDLRAEGTALGVSGGIRLSVSWLAVDPTS